MSNNSITTKKNKMSYTYKSTSPNTDLNNSNSSNFLITPYQVSTVNETSKIRKNKKTNSIAKTFGDHLTEKDEGSIRIVSQNVNCIGTNQQCNQKEERAKNWLIQNNVDITGWQETGVAFHMLPRSKRLSNRMQDIRWNKIRVSSTNNKHESNSTFQYGGTSVMAFDEAAHRIKATGADLTGLGRWSWILFEGKSRHLTRIISAYVPCKSSDKRHQTVYNQHKRYFWKRGIQRCPRKLMHIHLVHQIKTWQESGENIVLMVDANENLEVMGPLQTMLKYECQLIDPIRQRYAKKNQPLPATSLTGSKPIDSIFVSTSFQNIIRGGWIRVEDSIGDHRAIFIDLPTQVLLGENPFHIHRSTARRLVCDQPKVVQKYNELLNRQLENQHTFAKYEALQNKIDQNQITPTEYITYLNKLDRSITNAIIFAEKRCRKLRAGQVPYSPEINEAGNTINVWNNIIRKKKGCNISSTYIKRISKKAGISININQLSLSECEQERKLATKKYKHLKKSAKQSREQFLVDLAEQHSQIGNSTISSIISRMNRNEDLRASYRRIKIATKPYFGATEKVLLQDGNSDSEEITTDKKRIEIALCNENKKKFMEAYSSPFLQSPLIEQLGQTATTKDAKKILNGTFPLNPNLEPATNNFIQQLRKPQQLINKPDNNDECKIKESEHYWKKKREKTNSSMSSRHIGTYKALTFNNIRTLKMVNKIANTAFKIGEPLERWTHDLDVSLLKKPNKFRPSELRTIGTLEADFNQQASLHFSKRMMHQNILNMAIPPSQYAKKGNRAVEAAIVKVLFYDYLRLTKRNGAFITMDLRNCFDRMAHPVTSLSVQRLGVSANVTKCMIKTICRMKHYIRTAYGDSDWSYIGTDEKPLQGSIQGNGAASPMFVAISCVILAFLESTTKGISVLSAISLTLFTLSAIMYVDDTDILIAADEPHHDVPEVQVKSQKAATAYQKGVQQTGGNVRPDKCRWYLIAFQWKAGKWSYKKNMDEEIILEDENGRNCTIKRLESHQGFKGLGVITAPDGNWKDHTKYLIDEKIKPWNKSIQTSYLQRQDVYRAAFTSIFKTIDYTLPATYMDTKQCKAINVELHRNFLPKIGVDVHLPLVYRYAPKKFQGLNSLHVENKQFIEKMKMFLMHASTNTQLGKSIHLILEAMHIQIGTNHHIFSLDYDKYQCLSEKGWITHLWEMTHKHQIKLLGYYEKPSISRINDYALMDKLVELDIHTDEDMSKINRCRIFLQAMNLSDIVNGEGKKISNHILNHRKDPDRTSKYQWPSQPYPTKSEWDAWDDAIRTCWTNNENFSISPILSNWIQSPNFTSDWKYSPSTRKLYYKVSSISVNQYEEKNINRRSNSTSFQWEKTINKHQIPNDSQTAIVNRAQLQFPILETTFPTIINYVNPEKRKLHQELELFFDQIDKPKSFPKQLINDIINGDAIAVTDASVSPFTGVGASSFVITSTDLQTSFSGSHGVPKGSTKMDSYRAELYGIYATLMCLHDIVLEYKIKTGSITIACDNKASLQNSLDYNTRASVSQGSFDILWAISDLKKDLPIRIHSKHVKAHQDKRKSRSELTLLETINCVVDVKAGEYREYIENNSTYQYSTLHWFSNWSCHINGNPITANLEQQINEWIYTREMKSFLVENKGYHKDAFDLIDWSAIEKASSTLTNSRQIWLTKHVTGFCATASKMKKRELWENNKCPLCNAEKEDIYHLMTCLDCRARETYKKSLQKLDQYMQRSYTHPSIHSIIIETLSDGTSKNFKRHIPSTEYDTDFIEATTQQNKIGWLALLNGHMSKKWSEIQSKHFHQMYQQPPSVHNWAKNIVLKLYDISYAMWTNRNDVVHEKVEENLNLKESKNLEKQILKIYNDGPSEVLETHSYMFEENVEMILDRIVSEKKYWVETMMASKECVKNRISEIQNMNDIMKLFATVPD